MTITQSHSNDPKSVTLPKAKKCIDFRFGATVFVPHTRKIRNLKVEHRLKRLSYLSSNTFRASGSLFMTYIPIKIIFKFLSV